MESTGNVIIAEEKEKSSRAEQDANHAALETGGDGEDDIRIESDSVASSSAVVVEEANVQNDRQPKSHRDYTALSSIKPPPPSSSTTENKSAVENARGEINKMARKDELDDATSTSLQTLFREHEALKDKVSKLKALLGRSAKAQREAKVELDASNKKLEATLQENQRLHSKIEKLASRPTHMELLADFETNFDRAILSMGHQSGGQDTASAMNMTSSTVGKHNSDPASLHKDRALLDRIHATVTPNTGDGVVVDSLLMQEMLDSKQRVEKLEKLNANLTRRSSQLETDVNQSKRSLDELLNKISHLELEKRMSIMEAEQATRALQEKAASLSEMQMEIDMVTQSAQKSAARAAAGEDILKTAQTDKLYTRQLEDKVKALQEWAVASNEAKTLAQDRVRSLEVQLRRTQQNPQHLNNSKNNLNVSSSIGLDYSMSSAVGKPGGEVGDVSDDQGGNDWNGGDRERILDSTNASLVVGAGDVGMRVYFLELEQIQTVNFLTERVLLRWTFDLTQEDSDISFSILKGACETAADRRLADKLIQERVVTGGAGGEVDNAFSIGRACTLVWSNSKSWIRPRTIKYSVQAVVLMD